MPPTTDLNQTTGSHPYASLLAGRAWPALLAAILGVLLLYLGGFSQIPEIHNAAHDARHAAGFPCH